MIDSVLSWVIRHLPIEPLRRVLFRLYSNIYRSRTWKLLYMTACLLAIYWIADHVVTLGHYRGWMMHSERIGCIGLGLLLASAPMLIIGHGELQYREHRRRLSTELGWVLGRIGEAIKLDPARKEFPDLAVGVDSALAEIRRAQPQSRIIIMSSNLVYLTADRWLPKHGENLRGTQFEKPLRAIADSSAVFRDAIETFVGDVHFLVPDTDEPAVQAHLRDRVGEFGLNLQGIPPDFFLDLNRDAQRWIGRELRAARRRRRRGNTLLHLVPKAPAFRLMSIEATGACFIQSMKERAGVLNNIVRIDRSRNGAAVAGIEACLSTLVSGLRSEGEY